MADHLTKVGNTLTRQVLRTADGAAVVQMTADGRTSRQWQLRSQTGGEFVLVNRDSGKVLDVKGGSTADGVAPIRYRDVGSSDRGMDRPSRHRPGT